MDPDRAPVPEASAERSEDASELLDELLSALVRSDAWSDLALPDELIDRLVRYFDGPAENPAPAIPAPRPGEVVIMLTLDRMLDMQVRELRWGDPFREATPAELAAIAGGLLRAAIPIFMAQGRLQ
jgi:hypothetical protein